MNSTALTLLGIGAGYRVLFMQGGASSQFAVLPMNFMPQSVTEADLWVSLGDGTAETGATVYCPYCNETVEIAIDPGGGSAQEYVEDCGVCCQPWTVSVEYRQDGTASVSVTPLDE